MVNAILLQINFLNTSFHVERPGRVYLLYTYEIICAAGEKKLS